MCITLRMVRFIGLIILAYCLIGLRPTSRQEAANKYGRITQTKHGVVHWADADQWLVDIDVSRFKFPVDTIQCNKDLVAPLLNVLIELQVRGLLHEIEEFNGCYNLRYVRGYERRRIVSAHAYGLALDINASTNRLGQRSTTFSAEFVDVWERHGFTWGGHWRRRPDPMHFSYSWEK